MNMEHDIDDYVERHREQILEELTHFCAQPSISSQGTGIREMVALVRQALHARGFTVNIVDTPGNPVILAEHSGQRDDTWLFYNHYDVQPVDPLHEWQSPPFQPTVKDEKFYARGAMDDKGHLVCRLAAIDAVKAVYGELPCRIKFIIEGEEEINSPHLPDFVRQHAQWLQADACLWEFGDVDYDGTSIQYLGFRGILYVELAIRTAAMDAHSGIVGTLFPNAAWRLNWALSSLKSPNEVILIPSFYDDVVPPTARDLELMAQLPDMARQYEHTFGVKHLLPGLSDGLALHRAAVFSPSCTICGITTGYQGPGSKTVLPASATAKIDFRLVPNQTPDDILQKLRLHLDTWGFSDIHITPLGRENPARTAADDPAVVLAVEAAREVYGKPQRMVPMCGGSGPAYLFTGLLGMPVVTAGIGYPDSRIHAPNENIRLRDLFNGIRHTARIITRRL